MIKNFVIRPLFTLSIYIIILLIGLFSLTRLPLDFLPNIAIPTLTVITPYPGASAEDIETTVSKVIEDSVATVPNIDKITSNSQENLSTVTISFKWGTDLNAASADVRDKLDQIRATLPNDIQPPIIYKFDLSQIPVLIFGVSADQSYKDLYQIADKKISQALKRIQGVGTVSISGGLQRQINIDIDRERLEAYHLSLNQITLSLQAANLSMPAGSIKTGPVEYGIRVPGEFTNIDQIRNTIVGSFNGNNIYLSDVASVNDTFKEPDNMTDVDGKPGVTIQVQKESSANTVSVVKEIKKQLDSLAGELPPDIKITYILDTSESIVRQINELTNTMYWSFLFVMLTVLFFLRNIRGSFIVAMAIPFSIIAAFVYMYFSGASINIISLASIIIAIGVVVDDAIVVLENVYRHRDKKNEPAREAAIFGTGEVAGAVLASTTTNVVIFIPLLLVSGFIGLFFNQLSAISIVIMSMSLAVAISLTPMLCSQLITIQKYKDDNLVGKFYNQSEKIFEAIEETYKRMLNWALERKRLVLLSLSLLFILSMVLFSFVGTEFFPDQDTGSIQATVDMPAGTRWDQTGNVMQRIEQEVKKNIPELEYIMVSAGHQTSLFTTKSGPNYGHINMKVVPLTQRKRSIKELQRVVANIAYAIPGVKEIDFSSSGANAIAGGGKPVTIEIYGSDFDLIDALAEKLKEQIEKVPGVVDLALSREKSNPEYAFQVDRQKAATLGLTVYDIASITRGYVYGDAVTKYREGGDQYDIFVRLNENSRKTLDDIKGLLITSRTGSNIALGNIADVVMRNGPQVIERKNQQRYVRIEGDYVNRPLGDITKDIQKIIKNTSVPGDLQVKIAGSSEQIAESFRSLLISLLFGIALIYLVMVAQFESFIDPFIIMFAVPFAVMGVIWALFLTGNPFGIMSFIGLILVTGVAVKNSIVLVDYINILRARGLKLVDAIKEAGKTRLRPILMTSSTAILGLMPIIISRGEGSGFWKPMAISVVGGLLVSATISLIFVPTLYFVIEERLRRKED